MMTEEIQGAILSVSFKTCEFSIDFIDRLIETILKLTENKDNLKHGKQTMKSLNKHNCVLDNVDVTKTEFKTLKTELKKSGVDFAIMQDSKTKDYKVFFKAKDIEQINFCLKNHISNRENSLEKNMKNAQKKADLFNELNQDKEKNNSQNRTR